MTEETLGKIGKYELVETIGEGAMGRVYRALDPVLGRNVAIKLMSASIANDAHLRDRFLREARAAANLQHPNIITIYDFGETDGHPFIAMEHVEGTDLAHLIELKEPLSLESKVQLVIGLLNGLAYAHTKGVVHRDIKPANIRVMPDGRIKIMDFGIAHLQGSEITHSGAVLGTPDYMAPEQVRGLPVTAATDLFACGAVLYELLTYEKPFTGETLHAVLFKVVTENPRPIRDINPSLPESLQRIVDTALSKEPGTRYPTADAMAADLSTARNSLTNLETVATLRFNGPLNLGLPPLSKWKENRVKYGAGAASLLALVVLAWALIGRGEPSSATSAAAVPAAPPVQTPQVAARPDSGSSTAAVVQAPPPPAAPRPVAKTPVTPRRTAPRPAAPPPAAVATTAGSGGSAADRSEILGLIQKLEDAISAGRTSAIKAVMPGLKTVNGWDSFFKTKRDIKATLQVNSLDVSNNTASAKLNFSYTWVDTRDNQRQTRSDLKYEAILEKSGSGWIWKDFK